MAMPPMNLSMQTSIASRADAGPQSFSKAGNVYNFGGAASGGMGQPLPGWLLAAAAVAAVLWLTKRKG